ncbi:hypothetical protein OSB04_016402 [Centaurea solstitialis]|uniref:Bromo domain-containing protein n=1 Tax=Centaurea solstitialis TaxID=347529 RepID=A0AA38TJ14_9ASTR|nr:hypothetical protein OSB04_016402 [Centaurea solstitialis]
MKRKRASAEQKPKRPWGKKALQKGAAPVAEYDVVNEEAEEFETSMSCPPLRKSVSDDKTEENVNSLRTGTEMPRTGTVMNEADLGIEKAVHGRMENFPNSLREMIVSIIKEMSKEAGGLANLSKSLVDNPTSNGQMGQPHASMDLEENESRPPRQNPEYKQHELNAALTVIKKTMKLDAADPFNRPVDPVALEIPDYFDVIDTPMDFGTICNNLENGLKYMNSADVFKDVQYIWYNCLKYNKKGDYILELMKRVKTFFMKYWMASGLHTEQSPASVETGLQPSMHNEEQIVSPVTPAAGKILPSQLYSRSTSLNENKPRFSSNEQHHAPEFMNADAGAAESSMILRHNKREKDYPLAPLEDNFDHLQQNVGGSNSNQELENQPWPINIQAVQPHEDPSHPQSSPQQDDHEIVTPDSTSIQKKRQGRGPTRCVKLLNTVGRIRIATNELGQPVGPEASQLTSFLGLTARDGKLAPLTYSSWSKVPEDNKENMWQKVLTKFDIDPLSRSWVLMSLGTKWRNFKSLLKSTRYDTHSTDEERLADRDERVLADQWSVLVSQWSSQKWQHISAQNKANRARQKFSHTSGKKSFARIREEERAKRPDGQEPSRAELFILTRTRKNGQPVNEATAAVISQLRESATQKEETLVNKDEPQDDAYSRIMGQERKGGVSLYGLNANPSRSGIELPTRAEALKMVTEKNAEVLEMKEKLASVEQTCSQMASQMAVMVSMMAAMQKATPAENFPNAVSYSSQLFGSIILVDGSLVPVSMPYQAEPTSTSHDEIPAKQTRGRKKKR